MAMNKYIIQPSNTQPNGWVLTDTEYGIVIVFEDGKFNETQKPTMLENMPELSPNELARIISELGLWGVKYHSSKLFDDTYGIECSEDDKKHYLYRREEPKWRMEVKEGVNIIELAASLTDAADFLIKKIKNERNGG